MCVGTGQLIPPDVGANYTPPVGSVVAGLLHSGNYSFNCDQFNSATMQITTLWSLEGFLGLNIVSVNEVDHPEFIISGTLRGSTLPFPTYRNYLTIVNLTQRLDNTRLYCGTARNVTDGFWEIRVYCKHTHTHTCNITLLMFSAPPVLNNISLTVTEGDNVTLDLSDGQIPAFPFPNQFEWTRNGDLVFSTSNSSFGYPILSICSVARFHSGLYSLTATNNELGNSIPAIIGTGLGSVQLEVYCK